MAEYKFDITTNEYLPLRDVVFNNLRDAILNGSLKPGERLMENHLAEKLGVSRTPVREALRMLEIEHLVELIPRKGAQVLDLSATDLKNVLEIRSCLESLALRLACGKMNAEQIKNLKELNEGFIKAFDKEDYEEAAKCDEEFHNSIVECTGNDRLLQIINSLKIQAYRYRLTYIKLTGSPDTIIKHHNDMIYAIENNLPNMGDDIAKEHIRYQSEFILKLIDKKE